MKSDYKATCYQDNESPLHRFLNGPTPASFSIIFGLFKQTLQFLQQTHVKKCQSSIRCQDWNPQPLERESLPVTTRSGLPSKPSSLFPNDFDFSLKSFSFSHERINDL